VRAPATSAVSGRDLTRLYSYHVAKYVKDGRPKILLTDAEHSPLPVHLLTPHGRMKVPKVRAFFNFAVPRLRSEIARVAAEARILTWFTDGLLSAAGRGPRGRGKERNYDQASFRKLTQISATCPSVRPEGGFSPSRSEPVRSRAKFCKRTLEYSRSPSARPTATNILR
jgi:hypothetical protein